MWACGSERTLSQPQPDRRKGVYVTRVTDTTVHPCKGRLGCTKGLGTYPKRVPGADFFFIKPPKKVILKRWLFFLGFFLGPKEIATLFLNFLGGLN